jgi:REP element-mobilizing transposase RayT
MPRFRRIENNDRIFFVTTNLLRSVRPFNKVERDIALSVLSSVRREHAIAIAGYVVMPDHLHLLLVPGPRGLAAAMHQFKRWCQHKIAGSRHVNTPLWQKRYFDHIIRRVRNFWEKLEYIHNNPVVAGLVAHPSDWRWSSHSACAKVGVPLVPVDDLGLPTRGEALLWPARWKQPGE